jgi:UDP-N-acetylglucosamine 2-epimerase (non-hydrolysing)
MKLTCVIGARPNYMKVAPVLKEIAKRHAAGAAMDIQPLLIHTGQHYDVSMSDAFFVDLGLPAPDEFLGVGGGAHAVQTARVMSVFDEVCERRAIDAILVVGDVNSTLACALVASKRGIKVIHVEAGLRSFDRSMPEEVNRVLTDQISDLLLITSEDAFANLQREGIPRDRVRFVGNPMIDSMTQMLASLGPESPWISRAARFGGRYVVVTLHRPSNVDRIDDLVPIVDALRTVSRTVPVVFPIHPRTAKTLASSGFALASLPGDDGPLDAMFYASDPLGYRDFLDLMRGASLVVTDSGGIQEETTVLGVPCATVRPNTERPVTIEIGTNDLIGSSPAKVIAAAELALRGEWKRGAAPPLWDGRAAERIVDALVEFAG